MAEKFGGKWWPLVFMVLVVVMAAACDRRAPIKIGFVGGLTGRLADLGVSGRNGALLAVERINKAGGINGRRVVLIIRDDKQDAAVAKKAIKELIGRGVAAIIGHMTSSMSMVSAPIVTRHKMVMISPTTSTNKLAGIDDYFLRVMPPNKSETAQLASYAFKTRGVRRIAAVYDLSNRAYTREYYKYFRSAFTGAGGKIVTTISFTSGTSGRKVSFVDLARGLLDKKPDGILMVAGAVDTAMICQQLMKLGSRLPIFSCAWAMTTDLMRNGGPAVEGLIFFQLFNRGLRTDRYLRFKKAFRDRFGADPNFAAAHAYDAANVLFAALKKDNSKDRLRRTIIRIGVFKGVQGDFRIDRFGDAIFPRFLVIVKRGRFKVITR